MDTTNLNYFIHAARHLNFTKAARECFISQTAMSLAIARMEKDLGFTLFERNNRSMRLTPAGEAYLEWATSTLKSHETVLHTCRMLNSGYSDVLKIGFSTYFEALHVSDLIRRFSQDHPSISVEQRILPLSALKNAIITGEIDAVIVFENILVDVEELVSITIEQTKLYPVISSSHPLSHKSILTGQELKDYDLVYLDFDDSKSSQESYDKMLSESNIQYRTLRKMHHMEELLLYVDHQNAYSLFPDYAFNYMPGNLSRKSIEGFNPTRFLVFAYRKDHNKEFITDFYPNE